MAFGNQNVVAATFVAKDQASKTVGALRKNIMSLGTRNAGPLGGMIGGFGAAALGIGIVTGLFIKGVAGALAEEKQLIRLDQALRNNVKGWDGNRDAIDKAVTAGQNLAFTDDDLRESLIKLLPATKDQTKAIEFQGLAMSIARGRNIDLATATDIVIKANMGNVGALRRMGINIDKASTATEILTELQKTYVGQAEMYATSTVGRFERAQIKYDEFLESIGSGTAEVLGGALVGFEQFANFLETKLTPDDQKVKKDIGDFTRGMMTGVTDVLESSGPGVRKGIERGYRDPLLQEMFDAKVEAIKFARGTAQAIDGNLADALKGSKDVVKTAMDTVMWAIKNPMALVREQARIEGAMTTLQYKRGLASNTDMVNTVIDQQMQVLIDAWQNITGKAYTQGANAGAAWKDGYKDYAGAVTWGGFNPNLGGGGKRRKNRAAGGSVDSGATYLVGERGPELLHMGGNGSVTPNNRMGSAPIIVQIDGHELFRILDERMGKRLAMTSGNAYTRS